MTPEEIKKQFATFNDVQTLPSAHLLHVFRFAIIDEAIREAAALISRVVAKSQGVEITDEQALAAVSPMRLFTEEQMQWIEEALALRLRR